MPRISEKLKLIDNLKETAFNNLIKLELSCLDYEEQHTKEDEIIDDLIFSLTTAEHLRYAVPFVYKPNINIQTHNFLTNIFPSFDEAQFAEVMRISWRHFQVILDLIKDDHIFQRRQARKQFPIAMQLMIVLYRLGATGERAHINKIASFFKIGDGGTIAGITSRIFTAILNLANKYLNWPSAEERQKLVLATLHELPDCIGYVDCFEIKLAEPPLRNKTAFYMEDKEYYAIKVQMVCDYRKRIRHVVAGVPGGIHDNVLYTQCVLATNPTEYFDDAQFLIGDSSYTLSATLITPAEDNVEQIYSFNDTLHKYRGRIEQCFEQLKERFCSLQELNMKFKNPDSMELVARWVTACAILYNILLEQQAEEEAARKQIQKPVADETYAGEAKRQKLMMGLIKNLN